MSEATTVEFILAGLGVFFTVLWYLLQQKDAKQQKDIELLWTKHDLDAKELELLKLQIASQHYVKSELDSKFDRMEETFKDGFKSLGMKVDHLTTTLITQHGVAGK